MHFRIRGLAAEPFANLFTLSDAELAQRCAVRRTVDADHGYPCRISLTDAKVGDEVILVNHEHLDVATPYRSRHAIYVRAGEVRFDAVDTVPDMLRRRLLSLRGFDVEGMMTSADVVEGRELEAAIARQLADPQTLYLHAHIARPGCYAAHIERA
ncbi:MAG: DUF1203 domain-containing protein [Proteobacteria bacterium]|uniref:DUF1203 domain-containing protein n=1 Tax=Rudaea sp. TaxID=2136325 RepID=UPI001DAE437D|nr:DUF1203 domain-containing protein [Pseudomonadota bacterium]MBS0567113.1 DUF1203 domain-containing protein [Pseudomonadota bacterium]